MAAALLGVWDAAVHDFWHVTPKADVAKVEDEHEGTATGGGEGVEEAEEAASA